MGIRCNLFISFNEFHNFSIFFFFQAEDGIRDGTVTGVQTCALPISATQVMELESVLATLEAAQVAAAAQPPQGNRFVRDPERYFFSIFGTPSTQNTRSEERRVGKECRSRWAQCR